MQSPLPLGRFTAFGVLALTAVAAILRLIWLDRSPPGLNQDEAINAWNAVSLIRTGTDMVGVRWPIFYFHSIGDNRTPLFIYWLIPFHALGGLNVVAMRMAAAVSGILCVPLMYWVGARLFSRPIGLLAAAFLVANPWHLSSTRWAIDGSIVPLVSLVTLAAILRADLPFADGKADHNRPVAAALAGAIAGLGCYGYWAIRLHFPIFLALAFFATYPAWRAKLRTRHGALTVAMFGLGLVTTFGPLAARHLTDPAIAIRGSMTRLWDPGTAPVEIVRRIGERYAIHFGPEFLFVRGDQDPGNAPADSGAFEWAMLPVMLIGLVTALRQARGSRSSRFLLAMVLAYPAGDLLARYPGVHAFRSFPGLVGLVLLAATGAVEAWRWLWFRSHKAAVIAAIALFIAVAAQDIRSLGKYFGSWRDLPTVYFLFHTDFFQACQWVRPRFNDVDAVIWTTSGVNIPFAVTLVGLDYDPARWASDPKDPRKAVDGWEYYVRYGKNFFLYGQECRPYVEAMQANGRPEKVLFVVRPHELGLKDPVHVIRAPRGAELLWICEVEL